MRTIKTLGAIVVLFWLAADLPAGEIVQKLPVSEVSVTKGADGFAAFSGEGIQILTMTGEPSIPFLVVRLLLPPDADLSTVSAAVENQKIEEVPGQWDVSPVPPPSYWDGSGVVSVWPPDKSIVDGRDVAIYGADALFPAEWVGNVIPGQMREWLLVEIAVAAVQYNPVQKTLHRLVEGDLVVTFGSKSSSLSLKAPAIVGTIAKDTLGRLTLNFKDVAPAYGVLATRPLVDASETTYAIITTNAIASASSELERFIANKERRGFEVQVVTEDDWGGGTGDAAAENIRSWLRENYLIRDIQYVLLIGNPHPSSGDVPMKRLWPRSWDTENRESPSDYYYADLTGNWDLDQDGLFGEDVDDFGVGGVDRNWEVLVGRIPYYGSISDLDHILAKIQGYESAAQKDALWRRNVLLPMEPSDEWTPGYHLGEAIKDDIVISKGWSFHRIYDEDYGLVPPPETTPTSVENVTAVWRDNPFGAVFWWTHGWANGAVDIMTSAAVQNLDDTFPSFTFQDSCHNAWPEDSTNLAYVLLRNGGIATVASTRVCWYYVGQTYFPGTASNAGMTYEYAKRLITDEMDSGQALYEMKQTLMPGVRWMWMNFTVFNVYGDPSIGLFTTQKLIYISSNSGGTAGGVRFRDEDILAYDPDDGAWSLFFDGSDVGVGGRDIDGFLLRDDGTLLMTFDRPLTVPGLGRVDDSDIVRFTPSSTGESTAGSFSLFFDGSDVGLTKNGEDIDAIGATPDGRLVISTIGKFSAGGASGNDEDLFVFNATNFGSDTAGTFELHLDASDVGLSGADVDAAWIDPVNGDIFLSKSRSFRLPGVSGDASDIFVCTPGAVGPDSTCTFSLFWDGSDAGFARENTDGISIGVGVRIVVPGETDID